MHFKGLRLSPFQEEAVRAIERGHSALVAAPTGSGKTLIAEYAIERVLSRGKQAIYTAPIKALSNQKFRDFRHDLGSRHVGILTGDVTIHPEAPLLVMTTEIFRNTLFENPARLETIETVVFDEIHYLDDAERGTVWEESLIFAPRAIRFVCLSATVSNLDELAAWLRQERGEDLTVIHSERRPVPLEHHLYLPGRGIVAAETFFRSRRPRLRAASSRGRRVDWKDAVERVRDDQGLPALFFCFSRRECQAKARAAFRWSFLTAEQRRRMLELFDEIAAAYELDLDGPAEELRTLASRGIAYHHAGMLPVHKEVVERLFTSGLLKLLFTTETFAVGVNMPARTVLFSSLRKFNGTSFVPLRTREYSQMAGRAGRLGMDKRGQVVSLLDPRDADPRTVQRILRGRVEPIESRFNLAYATLLNLVAHMGRERVPEAWEHSLLRFQNRGKRGRVMEGRQRALLRRRLELLEDRGYLEGNRLAAKGRVASRIQGYEIATTECLFAELLDDANAHQIAVLVQAFTFEERRWDEADPIDPALMGDLPGAATRILKDFQRGERAHGITDTIRLPDFRIASAIDAWSRGAPLERIERITNLSPGDFVRTVRVTIQVLRQMRFAAPDRPEMAAKLAEALRNLNRDVVDARHQLELGDALDPASEPAHTLDPENGSPPPPDLGEEPRGTPGIEEEPRPVEPASRGPSRVERDAPRPPRRRRRRTQ